MEIIKAIWRHLIKLLILNLILVPFMVLAPAIFVVLPLLLIFKNPHDDFSGLAQFFAWTGPLSCAFWMLVSCHWSSVRQWQREGRDLGRMGSKWRAAHGGIFCTVAKATLYMFAGLIGSFAAEIVLLLVFSRMPYELFDAATRFRIWFAAFPLAAFFPVEILWVKRWCLGR